MSITRRLAALFKIKADKALDPAKDPRELLDYSYDQQRELLSLEQVRALLGGQGLIPE